MNHVENMRVTTENMRIAIARRSVLDSIVDVPLEGVRILTCSREQVTHHFYGAGWESACCDGCGEVKCVCVL